MVDTCLYDDDDVLCIENKEATDTVIGKIKNIYFIKKFGNGKACWVNNYT
jgi:hypothetical protein